MFRDGRSGAPTKHASDLTVCCSAAGRVSSLSGTLLTATADSETREMDSSLWLQTTARDPNVPSFDVYTVEFDKQAHDDRAYRLLRLQNGLRAMLVQEKGCRRHAVSMMVGVGDLQDPVRFSPFDMASNLRQYGQEDFTGMAELCAKTLLEVRRVLY